MSGVLRSIVWRTRARRPRTSGQSLATNAPVSWRASGSRTADPPFPPSPNEECSTAAQSALSGLRRHRSVIERLGEGGGDGWNIGASGATESDRRLRTVDRRWSCRPRRSGTTAAGLPFVASDGPAPGSGGGIVVAREARGASPGQSALGPVGGQRL